MYPVFDDRNSLNWILAGKARVAILPLYRCFRSLSKDPRLSFALPSSGAPLHWTVLVKPIKKAPLFELIADLVIPIFNANKYFSLDCVGEQGTKTQC